MMATFKSPLKQNMAPFYPDTLPPRMPHDVCPYPQQVMCDHGYKYRTYDGCCNNLRQPLWGASFQPLARFVPPQYADGKWSRVASFQPLARFVPPHYADGKRSRLHPFR